MRIPARKDSGCKSNGRLESFVIINRLSTQEIEVLLIKSIWLGDANRFCQCWLDIVWFILVSIWTKPNNESQHYDRKSLHPPIKCFWLVKLQQSLSFISKKQNNVKILTVQTPKRFTKIFPWNLLANIWKRKKTKP